MPREESSSIHRGTQWLRGTLANWLGFDSLRNTVSTSASQKAVREAGTSRTERSQGPTRKHRDKDERLSDSGGSSSDEDDSPDDSAEFTDARDDGESERFAADSEDRSVSEDRSDSEDENDSALDREESEEQCSEDESENAERKSHKDTVKDRSFLVEGDSGLGDDVENTLADDDEVIEVCPGFVIDRKLYWRLFHYQRYSLKWLYGLFELQRGGILGDDMGLGKTIQIIAFLSGMFQMKKISSVLVVMPVSLLGNWEAEFTKWAPTIKVFVYHNVTKAAGMRLLAKAMHHGGVVLTTYGLVRTRHATLCENSTHVWDYVILDEGHLIRNATQKRTAIFSLLARHRLIVTGTPIQNNLGDLWSLYHFAHQGRLFGHYQFFSDNFETDITMGRYKDATLKEQERGAAVSRQLKAMIQPYFLRRTKADAFSTVTTLRNGVNKREMVLWTPMPEVQTNLYKAFRDSYQVQEIRPGTTSCLFVLVSLKKVCDHPRLLPKKTCVELNIPSTMTQEELVVYWDKTKSNAFTCDNVSDENLLNESAKLRLTLELAVNLRDSGHKTLIFSYSTRILDMLQRILQNRDFSIARLDGTTASSERSQIVEGFQKGQKDVFLLTTKVGGVGLTLTAADRVIIYDPSWNPAADAQAVDRAFRIGQTRDVVVYRLITYGTIEEKMYLRQIFKDSVARQTVGQETNPIRYFTSNEIHNLFEFNDPSEREKKDDQPPSAFSLLKERHQKELSKDLKDQINTLIGKNIILGITHHDLMFSLNEGRTDGLDVSEHRMEHSDAMEKRLKYLLNKELDDINEYLKTNPFGVP